jgi:hypothetical protein
MKKPLVISNSGLIEERTRGDSLLVPFYFLAHFIGNALDNIFTTATSGAGNSATINADVVQGQIGAVRLQTGNGGTAGLAIHAGANMLRFSSSYGLRYICGAALPVLSNGTIRFTFRSGFSTTPQTLGDGTGFYIRCVDNVNGGNFQGVIRNGATETTVNMGFAPVANQNFIVGFEINQTYTSIEFFSIDINGNKVVRGSSALGGGSLPATNTLAGLFTSIQKAVGTGATNCLLDFIQCEGF